MDIPNIFPIFILRKRAENPLSLFKTNLNNYIMTKKVENAKKENAKPKSLAAVLDENIAKGGSWKDLIESCNAYNKSVKSSFVNTKGTIRAHVKYRLKSNSDYLAEKQMTDEGIF